MKFKADIATCEDGRDKILSVCQSNPDGDVLHEIIIQRSPKEFDVLTGDPGPRISCEDLGLDLEPGPESGLSHQGSLILAHVSMSLYQHLREYCAENSLLTCYETFATPVGFDRFAL
jgi:hypothetical protein